MTEPEETEEDAKSGLEVDGTSEPTPAAPVAETSAVKPKGPRIPLPSSLQEIVGALLFASESPLTAAELRTCVRGVAPEEGDDAEVMSVYQSCTSREIEQALHGLEKELERSECGFRLVCTGGAYRLQTASACGRYVRALLKLDRPSRLSRAALETLAIIAYRQPITKAEIEQIRGVAVDTIVKSLVDLQLVRLVGRSELPGHPFLYGTSPLFLEHFGLASLSELNDIDPTLQRSNPRERAKLFVKEKKPEEQADEGTAETPKKDDEKGADAVAVTGPAPDAAPAEDGAAEEAVQEEAEGPVDAEPSADEVAPRRVSFRPDDEAEEDDEPLVDDTPDEFDDEDDEDDEFDEDDAEVGDVPEGEEDEE
ncbi:MAG: SMC-Scp complex subunit ScpB [bacterium]|nr:SMC-Scp complex subunit ScpB [bacterium]